MSKESMTYKEAWDICTMTRSEVAFNYGEAHADELIRKAGEVVGRRHSSYVVVRSDDMSNEERGRILKAHREKFPEKYEREADPPPPTYLRYIDSEKVLAWIEEREAGVRPIYNEWKDTKVSSNLSPPNYEELVDAEARLDEIARFRHLIQQLKHPNA